MLRKRAGAPGSCPKKRRGTCPRAPARISGKRSAPRNFGALIGLRRLVQPLPRPMAMFFAGLAKETSLCSRQALFCGVEPPRRQATSSDGGNEGFLYWGGGGRCLGACCPGIRALESLFWLLAFCAACLVVAARARPFTRRQCGRKRRHRLPVVLASLRCAERFYCFQFFDCLMCEASLHCEGLDGEMYAIVWWGMVDAAIKKLDRYENERRSSIHSGMWIASWRCQRWRSTRVGEAFSEYSEVTRVLGVLRWPLRFLSALCLRHLCWSQRALPQV